MLYRQGFRVQVQSEEKLDFAEKSEPEVRSFFPEILDEIRGFAEGCHSSFFDMEAFMLTIGAFKPQPMCSSFAISDDSEVVFGRNYDFYYSFKKFTESYLTAPEDGYMSLGHSDVFIGREDGINENGLAVAITGVCEKSIKPGVGFVLAVRHVLDKCSNLEEATKSLTMMHSSTTTNFILADRTGSMAVIEASPEKSLVRKATEGQNFIVCTNHFVLPEMQRYEDLERRKKENWDTLQRYQALFEGLRLTKGKMNVDRAQKLLSDHTGHVCSHQKNMGTLWSMTAELKNLRVFRAEGNPCRTEYKEDKRLRRAVQKKSAR
jgi:predicted choloylglycine hydrolase